MSNIIHLPGNIDASQVSHDGDSISNKLDSFSNDLQEINEYLDESDEVIGDSIADLDTRVNNVQNYLDNSLYDTFVNTSLTEAQALANGEEDVVYYTSDTYSIVLNGQKYSSGSSSIAYPFKYANDTTDQANWDTNKIYLVKTATDGQFTMYYYNGSAWTSAGTQTLQALTAANVSYDLTNVNVGTGTVQSAIENLDASTTNKANDLLREFIEERMPHDTGSNLYGWEYGYTSDGNRAACQLVNDHYEIYQPTSNTYLVAGVTKLKVPKGTLVHYSFVSTSNIDVKILLSQNNPVDYVANNDDTTYTSKLCGYQMNNLIFSKSTAKVHDEYVITPEEGYLCFFYNKYNMTEGLTLVFYDPTLTKDIYNQYYSKSILQGAAMSSIVGLGYNILDYITTFNKMTPLNLTGFKYGCDFKRNNPTLKITAANKWKGNTSWYYFPDIDLSQSTNVALAFQNCTNLECVYNLNLPNVTNISGMFNGCTKLQWVGNINCPNVGDGANAGFRGLFTNCSSLKYVGKITNSISNNHYQMFYNCSALQRIEEIDVSDENYPVRDAGNYYGFYYTFYKCTALRYMLIKNLGLRKDGLMRYEYYFLQCTNWGVSNTAHPDARQSLVDSLITYSYDRAGANLSAHKTSLSSTDVTKILSGATVTINGNTIDITISDNGDVYNINDSEPLHTYINNITYYYYDSDNSTWTSTTISDETSIYYNNDDGNFYNADLTNNIMVEYVDSEWTNPYPQITFKLSTNSMNALTQEEKDAIIAKGYALTTS